MNYTVKYSDAVGKGFGGECKYPNIPLLNLFGIGECKINILSKYIDDKGILNHELKHAEQYKDNMFHILKYKFSKDYRLESELEAYKEQVKEYGYTDISECTWIIKALVSKYDLGLDETTITNRVQKLLV